MKYRPPGSPSVKKLKTLMSTTKVVVTIFWDESGVLYMEFLTKVLTMNSDRYCATLQSLKQCIRRMRPGRNLFLLYYDSARLHYCAQTQNLVGKLKLTVLPQPPYGPTHLVVPQFIETWKG
ncbi:hypothetical protein TNCV_1846351 [Trichonephila clavipes]|nr:hypothetical protein TNCV_1846351 [Trichonephila clavipes]